MGKKKPTKKSKKEHLPAGQSGKKIPPVAEPEKDENLDFGGLPDRNLKRNLGCG